MPILGIFFLFLTFGAFYPNPSVVQAASCAQTNTTGYQTCKIDEIKVKTDIYPGNQTTNPDNVIKVGKDGNITLSMKITLNQPDSLTFDSDELDFQSSDDKEISGMSFGVLEKTQNSTKCSTESKMTGYVPLLGNSSTYLYCNFDSGMEIGKDKQSTKVVSGGVLRQGSLNISSSGLQALGITEVGKTYELYMYPVLWYDGMVADSSVVLNGAGKSMYVKLYATDTEAKADTTRPSGVPDYGANIGSGTSGTEQSNTVMKIIEWVVGFLLGLLQELIYVLFYYFVAPLIQGMLSIRTYTDTFVAVIYPGWEIIRNVCNIIFIVALMAIAMGTLLRVEAYKSKQVLVNLILAALLVNFSLVIGQAILGVADTVQNQFLPNNVEVVRALGKDLMVSYRSIIYGNDSLSGNFSGIIRHVIFVILSAGSFSVFLALAAFLFIRVVMLWVLLMISPIAYAAGALPSTAHYRQEWWQNFIKYAFFTPIMAFFINLTAIIATQQKTNPILQAIGVSEAEFGDSSFAKMIFQVGGNLIMLVFLVVGMKVAEQFSIMGASKLTGFAQKGMYAPLGLAKVGGGYIGRKWNEATSRVRGHEEKVPAWRAAAFAALNPVAFAKGFKKQSEERAHRAQAKAEATGLEVAEQQFSSINPFSKESIFRGGSYKRNPHVLQHEKEEEDEQAKKLQNLSREEVAKRAGQIFKMGDSEEDMAYKRGVIKLAMSKGYIDDIVMEAHKNKEGRDMVAAMMTLKDSKGNLLLKKDRDYKEVEVDDGHGGTMKTMAMEYNNATRRAMYKAMFGVDDHGHLKDHAAMRLITQEGEKEGMDTGHLEYMTDMRFNETTGHFEWYDLDKNTTESDGEKKMAAAEIAKKDSRTQAKIAWHSLMSSDGGYFSEEVYAKVAKAFVENAGFMQERTANMLIAGTTDTDKLRQIIEEYKNTGVLNVDAVSAERIEKMKQTDPKALAAVFQRFINENTGPKIDARVKSGFSVQVVERNKDFSVKENVGVLKKATPLMSEGEIKIMDEAKEKDASDKNDLEKKEDSKAKKQAEFLAAAMAKALADKGIVPPGSGGTP